MMVLRKPKKPHISHRELLSVVQYDKDSGKLTWAINGNRKKIGSEIGGITQSGRRTISIHGIKYSAHRLIWFYVTGKFPRLSIDHIDGNPSNNSWNNLREADHTGNSANAKLHVTNTSGFKGVTRNPHYEEEWMAQIVHCGRLINLGYFKNKEDAARAYDKKAKELFGDYARTNEMLGLLHSSNNRSNDSIK